jgi:uncharacterized membrane protein YqgA involved in biofilm formation
MVGTLVNTGTVLVGSLAGMALRRVIRPGATEAESPLQRIVMQGIGLFTIVLGVKMGLETRQFLIVVLSIVLGGICGQLIGIEEALGRLAERLRHFTTSTEGTFVTGFVTASVLFCAGPMTVLGSVQDGLQHNPSLLLIKSIMDGASAVILTSALGIGVMFSALTVLAVQGLLTLLAAQLQFLVAPSYLAEFTAVGGVVILGIGTRLLGIKDIKAGNLLPALVLVVLAVFIALRLGWRG